MSLPVHQAMIYSKAIGSTWIVSVWNTRLSRMTSVMQTAQATLARSYKLGKMSSRLQMWICERIGYIFWDWLQTCNIWYMNAWIAFSHHSLYMYIHLWIWWCTAFVHMQTTTVLKGGIFQQTKPRFSVSKLLGMKFQLWHSIIHFHQDKTDILQIMGMLSMYYEQHNLC